MMVMSVTPGCRNRSTDEVRCQGSSCQRPRLSLPSGQYQVRFGPLRQRRGGAAGAGAACRCSAPLTIRVPSARVGVHAADPLNRPLEQPGLLRCRLFAARRPEALADLPEQVPDEVRRLLPGQPGVGLVLLGQAALVPRWFENPGRLEVLPEAYLRIVRRFTSPELIRSSTPMATWAGRSSVEAPPAAGRRRETAFVPPVADGLARYAGRLGHGTDRLPGRKTGEDLLASFYRVLHADRIATGRGGSRVGGPWYVPGGRGGAEAASAPMGVNPGAKNLAGRASHRGCDRLGSRTATKTLTTYPV